MKIGFKKLSESATIPTLNNITDAGIDLYASENVMITAHSDAIIKTGIAWQPSKIRINHKAVMIVKSRSGLAFKEGVECTNAGVIDEAYRGEIGVKLYNTTSELYQVKKGDRIAQGVVYELPHVNIFEIDELTKTDRGENGFGSSGK